MKPMARILVAALIMSGATVVSTAPAEAEVGLSIGIGGPGWYDNYDYYQPCWWYRENNLPAPYRCYQYFHDLWGTAMYVDGDFLFRDRDDWYRWRDRDDYRHWRAHDWRHDRNGWRGDRASWQRSEHGHSWGHDGGRMNWRSDHGRAWGHDGGAARWGNHGGTTPHLRNGGGGWHGGDHHVGWRGGDGGHGTWGRGGQSGHDNRGRGGGHEGGGHHRH